MKSKPIQTATNSKSSDLAILNLKSEATVTDDGNYIISGKHYKNETFKSLIITMEATKNFTISDSVFENCKTVNGFFITKNIILKNVAFINFDCGDALHISSETHKDNVIVSGKKPGMLWIKPKNKNTENDLTGRDFSNPFIDISNYYGKVSITGIPLNKIIYNSERHVALTSSLNEQIDWKSISSNPISYWKLMIKKIIADGSTEGVFSVPPANNKNYETIMLELEILKKLDI